MRAGGGRTKSSGSLRADRKRSPKPGANRLRSESGKANHKGASRKQSIAVEKFFARFSKRFEGYIPAQRRLFGEETVLLPTRLTTAEMLESTARLRRMYSEHLAALKRISRAMKVLRP